MLRRWIIPSVFIGLLVPFIATLLLFIQGLILPLDITFRTRMASYSFTSYNAALSLEVGKLRLQFPPYTRLPVGGPIFDIHDWTPYMPFNHRTLGFSSFEVPGIGGAGRESYGHEWIIPLWFPAAILGIPAFLLGRALRRRHLGPAHPPKKPLHPLFALGIAPILLIISEWLLREAFCILPEDVGNQVVATLGLQTVFWGFLLATVPLPLWMLYRHAGNLNRRYRRWTNGQCVACGHNLRAPSIGDKCPECGTLIPVKTTTRIGVNAGRAFPIEATPTTDYRTTDPTTDH